MRAPYQCETRIRVTKKKTAHIQAAHGELLHCCRIAFRLTTVLSKSVGRAFAQS